MHFDEVCRTEKCIAGKKGDAYIGAMALNGLTAVEEGPTKGREYRSPGKQYVWGVQVSSTDCHASLQEFVKNLEAIRVKQDDPRTASVTLADGTLLEAAADGTLRVNGSEVYEYPMTPKGKIEVYEEVL